MMKFSKVLLLLLVNVGIREVFGQVKPPPEQLHPSLVERCAGLTTNADTFIADFFQCRGYHICRNRLYLGSGQCAEGLYFNNGMCDFPHNTRCLLCDPMKLDTDVHMLPIAGSCNEYSLCVNRIAARRTCANDFVFHDQDHACVLNDPAALVCAACPNIYSPNFVINIPAFGACNKFLRCTMQGSTPVECSPGQLFDIETNRCVPAAEATCQFPSITDCRPNEIHYVPSPNSCLEYFVCFNGLRSPNPLLCNSDFIFDINTFSCRPEVAGETECFDG